MRSGLFVLVAALIPLTLAGCHKSPEGGAKTARSVSAAADQCTAPPTGWYPTTGAPSSGAAPANPDDCFFYSAAWQNFLFATQGGPQGSPAFLNYPNIANMFGTSQLKAFTGLKANQLGVAVRDIQRPNGPPAQTRLVSIGDGVRQAGGVFGLIVDASGNPVFYSIHVNGAFAGFIKTNALTTRTAVEAKPTLEFPEGVAEFKAAWVITPDNDPGNANYILARGVDIPNLAQDASGAITIAPGQRHVTLKLIALHVAFVIKDHPEFIWSTFEHTDTAGVSDLAPKAASNAADSAVSVTPGANYLLFAGGASRATANSPCPGKAITACNPPADLPVLDSATQTFKRTGAPFQTSIFREFPGSKSDRPDEDDSVLQLNTSVRSLLSPQGRPVDVRANYRLVGAVWLEHPRTTADRKGDFAFGTAFANPAGQDTENRSRVVAGEDALSSTAMESFTQRDSTNCFSCHDLKKVVSDDTGRVLVGPAFLNVSHVISRHLNQP